MKAADPATARLLPKLRALCRRLPGTTETVSWGHPTFKAGGKTFSVLEPYRGHLTLCFKLSPPDAEAARADPRFFTTPYIGSKGWVSLIVDGKPDWKLIGELLLSSYWMVAPPERPRRRRPTAKKKRKRGRRLAT
jgi:predicted DNA-binding protein (MmcQ/YjbR family)